jgi:hypothetical protein
MPRYYFDSRDGDASMRDIQGVVLEDIAAAREQAASALAELARDVLPGTVRREIIVDVRNEARQTVLKTSLVFEAAPLLD